jgi:biopolymer transport protein ExbD
MVPSIRHATFTLLTVTFVSFASLAVLYAPAHSTGFKLYTLPPCSSDRQPRGTDYMGNMVLLEISQSDRLHINGSAFALSQITSILDLVYGRRASKDLFLSVDDQISYERFVYVLDRMQSVPLDRLVLLTKSSVTDLQDNTCLFDWKKWWPLVAMTALPEDV